MELVYQLQFIWIELLINSVHFELWFSSHELLNLNCHRPSRFIMKIHFVLYSLAKCFNTITLFIVWCYRNRNLYPCWVLYPLTFDHLKFNFSLTSTYLEMWHKINSIRVQINIRLHFLSNMHLKPWSLVFFKAYYKIVFTMTFLIDNNEFELHTVHNIW